MSKQGPMDTKDAAIKQHTQERKEVPMRQATSGDDVPYSSRRNVERLFDEASKTTSQIQQSVVNLQTEYLESCRKMFETSLSMQEELVNKLPFYPRISDAMLKDENKFVDACLRTYGMQNQAVMAAINAAIQSFRSMNENSKSFADVGRNLFNPWNVWQNK